MESIMNIKVLLILIFICISSTIFSNPYLVVIVSVEETGNREIGACDSKLMNIVQDELDVILNCAEVKIEWVENYYDYSSELYRSSYPIPQSTGVLIANSIPYYLKEENIRHFRYYDWVTTNRTYYYEVVGGLEVSISIP